MSDFVREIAVAERGMLQPIAEGGRAVRRGIVLYRSVDEPAPFAGPGRTLDRELGLIFQDDVHALCHGCGYRLGDLYS